jgi:hypothetical protein
MRQSLSAAAFGIALVAGLNACDDHHGYYGGGPYQSLTSFVGTTGVFAAWADPVSGNYQYDAIGSYAGKKQVLRGSVDFLTGADLSQPAGVEVYKANDGHIYALDLTSYQTPTQFQISNESAATVDDTCSLSGTAVSGANYDYAGVYFAADLQNTPNSSYFYRLPGADGVCDTADDVVHLVKTGMSTTDAPLIAAAMPIATVHTAQGAISGFVAKSGANLVLLDGDAANPVVIGTFSAPIGVAAVLPVGTVQGYPTGELFVVDGNIVYVNYSTHTTSAPLFTIPNWTPTNTEALFAASPTALYFSIYAAPTASAAASTTIYSMPADGSAVPVAVDVEAGRFGGMQFPVEATSLVFSVEASNFMLRALPGAGGAAMTLLTSSGDAGSFTATATNVYYTAWTSVTNEDTHVVTHSGTVSGIVGVNASVVMAPLANSSFVTGGEQVPWPNDTTTTQTPYQTLFQVTGLTPVTVADAVNGFTYTEDGVSGGTMIAIDATSNQPVATVGTLPVSTAVSLTGTFRSGDHTGFLDAINPASTQDPATRELYLLNSQGSGSLIRVTNDL